MKGNDIMYVNNFKSWALEWYNKYRCSSKHIDSARIGKQTMVVIDTRTGKIGIAKCHKNDDFSAVTGIGIAYARLKGVEIPQEVPQIKDLPNNTYFTATHGSKYQKIGIDIETGNIVAKRCLYPYDLRFFFPDALAIPCEE